jgi:3-oxoacyl-[acyl-carrier protein] reductase
MDLEIKDNLFCVTGATSGFGKAIAEQLIQEGANVIINARTRDRLDEMKSLYGNQIEILEGNITTDAVIANLFRIVGERKLAGLVVNAGGPPAMSFMETDLTDWDEAYRHILRWKVKIIQEGLDKMIPQHYGRIVFIESASVKQPIENLVLSNSFRLGVVGFVKTLSQEIADKGITLNVLAPGYHNTTAMERLFVKKSMLLGISSEEAKAIFENETKVGKLGDAKDLASLASWLLSPRSRYVTGQTISIDGGLIKGTMG